VQFEEIVVTPGCRHLGKTISELRVRDKTGARIIAVRKADGSFDSMPSPKLPLEEGDIIIGVGNTIELLALEEMFAPDGQERE